MTAQPEMPGPTDAFDDDLEDDEAPATDFSYDLNGDVSVELSRRGPELVVLMTSDRKTAETLASVVESMEWSMLRVTASLPVHLRSDQVTGFFDALVDSTVLDQFERVLFVAAAADADAALGYALCAPLSRVLIFGTPDTLSEDGRYPVTRDTLDAAEAVYVIADRPLASSVSAALENEGVSHLTYPLAGRMILTLSRYGVLDDILGDAMFGDLVPIQFARAMRARRTDRKYLRGLEAQLEDRPLLRLRVMGYLARTIGSPRYRRAYDDLRQSLQDQGVTLPPSHRD